MSPSELKPIFSALVLPPAGPLLLAALGMMLALRHRRSGIAIALAGVLAALLLSSHAAAVALARHALPQVQPATADQVRTTQAIIVLGGGIVAHAPEYGIAQPSERTLARLRYGVWLARRTGKPLGFAGGVGWAAAGTGVPDEGTVARATLQEEYGLRPQWIDNRSRDTEENAARMAELLARSGVRRIALVTDAWHMPRAQLHFRAAGLDVLPAPTDFPAARERPLLEWMPSAAGLTLSRQVLREWLALRIAAR